MFPLQRIKNCSNNKSINNIKGGFVEFLFCYFKY